MRLQADVPTGAPPEFLLIEHFLPHVGKAFRFQDTAYVLPLLTIVSDDRPLPERVKRRPFTLIFRDARQREWLAEGSYRCSIEDGPTYSIYVAPIQTLEPEFQDYQAVFN
ncbi:MAG: hypothetical protein JWR89_193 [Tardiphaga sp.]|uniref:DUF6916 family protein n=1 Tax=Tardiphaga sp. TaxID=1926292 RepID=UPI002639F3F7|nr:hypothetical protein [Tardiphaga sp.]MDB5500291.1 hypothetical protein [Tardiphaga sp.]